MPRQRFNADERATLASATLEVRDGRTWYVTAGPLTVERDCIGTQCAKLRKEVGKGTVYAYPGHVRPI